MSLSRIWYRVGQFWGALHVRLESDDLEDIHQVLTTRQLALFEKLAPSEQVHAYRVFQKVREQSPSQKEGAHPDLFVAALLHDIGKTYSPLRLWERVTIVLGKWLFPKKIGVWGKGPPIGWTRPFVVAAQHPLWGAEMAEELGVSPLARSLILYHQEPIITEPHTQEEMLLHILQTVDNES